MIRYNAETDTIEIVEMLSWEGTIKPALETIRTYFSDLLAEDMAENPEEVRVFLDWDPENGTTPFKSTKADLMQYLVDEIDHDEYDDGFSALYSMQNNLLEWIIAEFGVDEMNAASIFR